MKTAKTFLAIALALLVTVACEKPVQSVQEESFDINIDNFVAQSFYAMGNDGGTINLSPKAPFEVVAMSTNGSVKINNCSLNVSDGGDYTEEICVYVRDKEVDRAIKGFGYFNYPIVIRLAGAKSTRYLDAEELQALKNKSVEWSRDSYIKGTVKSVSSTYDWGGILRQPDNYADFYDFPICGHLFGGNVMSIDQTNPYDLEAKDIVVESEGVQVTVQAAWVKAYKLVNKMDVKAGDVVEIFADTRGVDAKLEKDLLVSPLSVVVIK